MASCSNITVLKMGHPVYECFIKYEGCMKGLEPKKENGARFLTINFQHSPPWWLNMKMSKTTPKKLYLSGKRKKNPTVSAI